MKVGKGSYSKVFGFKDEETVVKLIPFGSLSVREEEDAAGRMLGENHALREVLATQAVSQLQAANHEGTVDANANNVTNNFIQLQRISVLQGSLPSYLIAASSLNEHPVSRHKPKGQLAPLDTSFPSVDGYPRTRTWVAFEFGHCGHTLREAPVIASFIACVRINSYLIAVNLTFIFLAA